MNTVRRGLKCGRLGSRHDYEPHGWSRAQAATSAGSYAPANPELDDGGWTPIAGSLKGAKRYWQGLNTPGIDTTVGVVPYWTGPGAEPIRDDPLKNVFIGGEQCRPYVVIMLTDGDETCVPNVSETRDAAASLLTTTVDGQTYRIRTKPIGFGTTPGDTDIEALAHAGGTPDGPGFEGYYAQNEEELALAISQIISEALKFETCNDLDDDCDIFIDEDFPAKNSACDDGQLGICRGTGIFQCAANGGLECVLDNPGLPATPETCNGLDDDCDAKVDEGQVCQGCGTVEFCDGLDNDCDGAIDENITRPCGTNVGECTAGTEVCVNGSFEGCTAIGGSAEICDGLDNDCDGQSDEEPPALCPTGTACVSCQCAFPCQGGEFPCPPGLYCSPEDFCLVDPCFGVACEPTQDGDQTECVAGACVPSCELLCPQADQTVIPSL